jgi:hypothetical protein
MALPFGFLTRGAVGVSPSRPEAASAVGRGGNFYTHRRDPPAPFIVPQAIHGGRRGYGWIPKALGIGQASVYRVLEAGH